MIQSPSTQTHCPSLEPPVWRTTYYSQTDGEPFFYQKIVLFYPLIDHTYEEVKRDRTWREFFLDVCDLPIFLLPADEVAQIKASDRVIQRQENAQTSLQDFTTLYQLASQEQKEIYTWIMNSSSTFFRVLGPAGTGKSFLLHLLAAGLQAQSIAPVILAPTGIAAYTAGGQTIHRFFGIMNASGVVNTVRLTDFVKNHRRMALLIDEFSMISQDLLHTMTAQLSTVTGSDKPFAGILSIFFGDVGQLPAVDAATAGHGFLSPLWQFSINFALSTQHRQTYPDFIEFLSEIRQNKFTKKGKRFIKERLTLDSHVPVGALRLYTTREEVQRYNTHRVQDWPGDKQFFHSIDLGPAAALEETGLVKTLCLKIGVPVLLIDNVDVAQGWTNGTQCVVERIENDTIYLCRNSDQAIRGVKPITRDVYKTSYCRTQFPLVLGFSSTIHKVQSLTVGSVTVSVVKPFLSHGELYVACSRVRSPDHLYFLGIGLSTVRVGIDTHVLDFLNDMNDTFC